MMCFEYFFPEHPVEADNQRFQKTRKLVTFIAIGHLVFAILTLVWVAFTTFLFQFVYIILLYSFYMNMKVWILYLYAGILILNIITGLFGVIFSEDWGEFIVSLL